MLNISASIGVAPETGGGIAGSVDEGVDVLARWATELGFDTFTLWPTVPDVRPDATLGSEVAAGVRAEVHGRRDGKHPGRGDRPIADQQAD